MIEHLAIELLAAKAAEDQARQARLEVEERIIKAMQPYMREEGAATIKSGDYKVTVTTSFSRKVDEKALAENAHLIPDEVGKRVIRWKPEVSVTELKLVRDMLPEVYSVLARVVTTKPAKPAVKVVAA